VRRGVPEIASYLASWVGRLAAGSHGVLDLRPWPGQGARGMVGRGGTTCWYFVAYTTTHGSAHGTAGAARPCWERREQAGRERIGSRRSGRRSVAGRWRPRGGGRRGLRVGARLWPGRPGLAGWWLLPGGGAVGDKSGDGQSGFLEVLAASGPALQGPPLLGLGDGVLDADPLG
jgi:hypothetical protein